MTDATETAGFKPVPPLALVSHFRQDGDTITPDGVTVEPLFDAMLPVAWLDHYRWLFDVAGVEGQLVVRAVNATILYRVKGFSVDHRGALQLRLARMGVGAPNPPAPPEGISSSASRPQNRLDNPHGMPGAIARVIADLLDANLARIQQQHEEAGIDDPCPTMAISFTCPDCPYPEVLFGSPHGSEILRIPVVHLTGEDAVRDARTALREAYDRRFARLNGHSLEHFRELVAAGEAFEGYRSYADA